MVHWDCPWDVEEDSNILKGIYDYGMGNWEQIKMDTDLNLYNKVCVKELQRSWKTDIFNSPDLLWNVLKNLLVCHYNTMRASVVCSFYFLRIN